MPPFLRDQSDYVLLAVKLQPRASRNEIGEPLGNELRIKVIAPPVDAAVNEALLRLLAGRLDCPRGAVELVRGSTSRHKTILIRGPSVETIAARLSSRPKPAMQLEGIFNLGWTQIRIDEERGKVGTGIRVLQVCPFCLRAFLILVHPWF